MNITTPVSVLVVSFYEFVRAGVVATLLKFESTLIEIITEKSGVEEAMKACSAKHFPLIIIDESINEEDLQAVKRAIEKTRYFIVICQFFREDAGSQNLLKDCGLSGYFLRSSEMEVFREDVKEMLKGHNGDGIFLSINL